jgi:hypothetical protein
MRPRIELLMSSGPKFCIRTLFLLTTLSSICALMLSNGDWLAAVGFGVVALLTLGSVSLLLASQNRRLRKAFGVTLLLVACPLAWFSMIDRSWFVFHCPDCYYGADIIQYRICTVPAYQNTRGYSTLTQRVAADLGIPCSHARSITWHKHKLWGLLICKCPCINGTYRITYNPSWYDHEASQKVTALPATDSAIQSEFIQTVFVDHDTSFVITALRRAGVEPPTTE